MDMKLFCIDECDNVATALSPISAGKKAIIGECSLDAIDVLSPINQGHKVALKAIAPNELIIKYGVPIGVSTFDIAVGEWVHLHNMKSQFDERSSTLDLETGLSRDIEYG